MWIHSASAQPFLAVLFAWTQPSDRETPGLYPSTPHCPISVILASVCLGDAQIMPICSQSHCQRDPSPLPTWKHSELFPFYTGRPASKAPAGKYVGDPHPMLWELQHQTPWPMPTWPPASQPKLPGTHSLPKGHSYIRQYLQEEQR